MKVKITSNLHVNIQGPPAGKFIQMDRPILISLWNWYVEGTIYEYKGFEHIA